MDFTGERFVPDIGLETEIEAEHLQRYQSVQGVVTGKRVLDIASGAGYGAVLLAENAAHVCGVDIDYEAVNFARDRYKEVNLTYLQASLAALPFASGSFDVVISFETIEHVSADLHNKFLEEILRVLSPDGFLIISTPDKHIYSELTDYKNEFHLKEFYRQEFCDFLKQFFPHVCLLDQLQGVAYIITDNKATSCKVLCRDSSLLHGKYIIAVCGHNDIPESGEIGSVLFDSEGLYRQKIDRVLELQAEIVEKNHNIDRGWEMIYERDAVIEKITAELAQNQAIIAANSKRVSAQDASLENRGLAITRLEQALKKEQEKISELSESLSHIRSTKAWMIIQKIYRLKNKIMG